MVSKSLVVNSAAPAVGLSLLFTMGGGVVLRSEGGDQGGHLLGAGALDIRLN
jgi:hypothetical protein